MLWLLVFKPRVENAIILLLLLAFSPALMLSRLLAFRAAVTLWQLLAFSPAVMLRRLLALHRYSSAKCYGGC